MTRPLRLEYPGALYHVTSRGHRHGTIFADERDREAWLEILRVVCARCHFLVHAYCQMTNHYHLMVETVEGNLSEGMRQLNGIYTQQVNRRHGLVGMCCKADTRRSWCRRRRTYWRWRAISSSIRFMREWSGRRRSGAGVAILSRWKSGRRLNGSPRNGCCCSSERRAMRRSRGIGNNTCSTGLERKAR